MVAHLHLPPYDIQGEGDSLGGQPCNCPKGHADEDGQPVGTVVLLLGSKIRALSIPVQPGMGQTICLGVLLLQALVDIELEAGIGQDAGEGGAQAPIQPQEALLLDCCYEHDSDGAGKLLRHLLGSTCGETNVAAGGSCMGSCCVHVAHLGGCWWKAGMAAGSSCMGSCCVQPAHMGGSGSRHGKVLRAHIALRMCQGLRMTCSYLVRL